MAWCTKKLQHLNMSNFENHKIARQTLDNVIHDLSMKIPLTQKSIASLESLSINSGYCCACKSRMRAIPIRRISPVLGCRIHMCAVQKAAFVFLQFNQWSIPLSFLITRLRCLATWELIAMKKFVSAYFP